VGYAPPLEDASRVTPEAILSAARALARLKDPS